MNKFTYNNYATVKRRGVDGNYTYIYTLHKYAVRASGYDDPDFLMAHNTNLEYGFESTSEPEVRFASSISRSRSKVLQLGCNNQWDYFVTLTFSPESTVDRYDFKSVSKSLLKFFDNYKQRRSKDFKYLIIPEQHKDGAYHFHGFLSGINPDDLRFNDYGYLYFVPFCKKYGFINMSRIKDLVGCAYYAIKYICKDMFNTVPEPGTHLYFSSRGLNMDKIIKVGYALPTDFLSKCVIFESEFIYRASYESDIFSDYVEDFSKVDYAPDLPSVDVLKNLKDSAFRRFCVVNNFKLADEREYNNLCRIFMEELIDTSFSEYDVLVDKYRLLRNKFDEIINLTEDDVKRIEDIFNVYAVSDTLDDIEVPEQLDLFMI